MSFVSGKYSDDKKGSEGLPSILGKGPGDGPIKGFVPGEIAHIGPPNARTQIFIDTNLGKGNDIFMGFLWNMRKQGFHVDKIQERVEISPIHSQYYQVTVQQKQNMEQQIKQSLASIQSSISDYELLSHDIRRYKEYMHYFEEIEKASKSKNKEEEKRHNQTLKSLFIDHVDVHTGEGVALKLIAPRWPTIIVDFMRLDDNDLDPNKIAEKYQFSQSEGVVLSTKNKIYQQWKKRFKETVMSRYHHLKELVASRKKSIKEYRRMVRPFVLRHKMIHEFGETEDGASILNSFNWWRPSTQAVSIDMAEYWLWRSFNPPGFDKPPIQIYEEKQLLMKSNLPKMLKENLKEIMKNNSDVSGKYETISTFPSGIEPVDDWVMFLTDKLVKHYQGKYKYKSSLNVVDIMQARKNLEEKFKEYNRWDWVPSPYFITFEVETFRVVTRSPTGKEGETFIIGSFPDHPFVACFDTQNVMIIRELEKILQEKELKNHITDIIGDTEEGKKIEDIIKEDEYPNLYGMNNKKQKPNNLINPKQMTNRSWKQNNIRFLRSGPYDSTFMDRITSITMKTIAQNFYGPAVGYFKSAAMNMK